MKFFLLRCSAMMLLFFWNHLAQGQNFEVKWTDLGRRAPEEKGIGLYGSREDAVFTLFREPGSAKSLRLDKRQLPDLDLSFSIRIEIPAIDSLPGVFESLIPVESGFVVFSRHPLTEPAGSLVFYGQAYDSIGQPKGNASMVLKTRSQRGVFTLGIAQSPDKSKIMLYSQEEVSRKANARINLIVLTDDLKRVWEKTLEIPYPEVIIKLSDYLVDNAGHIYMISDVSGGVEKGEKYNRYDRTTRYVLMTYDPDHNVLKEFDVSMKAKWIISAAIGFTPTGNVGVAGFYSKELKFSLGGTFYFLLRPSDKKVIANGFMPFEDAFLSQFEKPSRSAELQDFYFDHFLFLKEGGAILLAEQYYEQERILTDPTTGRQSVSVTYYYNDIIAVKVNGNGVMEWARKIPKRQVTTDDTGRYSSYVAGIEGDIVYLCFNDHPDNLSMLSENMAATPKSYGSERKASLTVVTLNSKGEQSRHNVESEEDVIMWPGQYAGLPHALLLTGENRKNFNLGVLKVKKD